MPKQERQTLSGWANQLQNNLDKRIEKGERITHQDDKANSLIADLKWQKEVLRSVVMAVSCWEVAKLAALAARLCVRMPEEFGNMELYTLASNRNIKQRDGLLAEIGRVPVFDQDPRKAKEQLIPLLQAATELALKDHNYAYKTWFARSQTNSQERL